MPKRFTQLKLTELSLVDSPANPLAKAPIYKRDDSNGDKMETVEKSVYDTLVVEKDGLVSTVALLTKALEDNGFIVTDSGVEKKATPEFITISGEKVNKADVPEVVLKALEDAEILKADAVLKVKAEETLPHFDLEVAKNLMKFDLDEEILEALKAADAALAELMKEEGDSSHEDLEDPKEKLDALAKAYKNEHGGTYEKAFTAVVKTTEGLSLYNKTKGTK